NWVGSSRSSELFSRPFPLSKSLFTDGNIDSRQSSVPSSGINPPSTLFYRRLRIRGHYGVCPDSSFVLDRLYPPLFKALFKASRPSLKLVSCSGVSLALPRSRLGFIMAAT